MTHKFPDIKVWIWTVVVFIILQSGALIYYKNYKKNSRISEQTTQVQLSQISTYFRKYPSCEKVIVIGSSLTSHGIEGDNNIRFGADSTLLIAKIWASNSPISKFIERDSIVDDLIALQPDLVCIQTELAAIKFSHKKPHPILHKIGVLSGINNIVIENEIIADTIVFKPVKRETKSIDEIESIITAINQLESAKIKTSLLDIPKPISTEKALLSGNFQKHFQQVIEEYMNRTNAEHLLYDGAPLHFNSFKDGGHLNAKGSHYYTQWLVSKLKDLKL